MCMYYCSQGIIQKNIYIISPCQANHGSPLADTGGGGGADLLTKC